MGFANPVVDIWCMGWGSVLSVIRLVMVGATDVMALVSCLAITLKHPRLARLMKVITTFVT